MRLQTPFDATSVDPTQGTGQMSVGRHPVVIESSEVKGSKAGDSGYLQLNLRVTDGPGQGEGGPIRLNLYHSNAKTVEIAFKQLSAICHVTGVFRLEDSSQLHNIPFIVDVGPQKDPQYTEVKRVYDIRGNEPQKTGTGAGGAAQPQQAPQQQAPQQAAQPAWGQQQPQQSQQPQQAPAWGQPGSQQTAPQQAPQQTAPAWAQPQSQPTQPAGAPVAPWGAPSGAPATASNGAPPWGQQR